MGLPTIDIAMLRVDADPIHVGAGNGTGVIRARQHLKIKLLSRSITD